MSYACPKCQSKNLRVTIEVRATLIQHQSDDFETDIIDQDHEWGENSPMLCVDCDHSAIALEFEVAS